jgi:hypothetical protein
LALSQLISVQDYDTLLILFALRLPMKEVTAFQTFEKHLGKAYKYRINSNIFSISIVIDHAFLQ